MPKPAPKKPTSANRTLGGKWVVAEMPDMEDEYLKLTPDPHVEITEESPESFWGVYRFADQEGEMDGRVLEANSSGFEMIFTFVGTDAGDQVNGAGMAFYDFAKEAIVGEMFFHAGDDLEFVWKRKK